MRPVLRTAPILVSLLFVAACNGDDDAAPGADAPAVTEAPDLDDATIVISGFSFGDDITVPVGTTVTVVNDDDAPHTWTAIDGTFDSGTLGTGDEFEFTFDSAGSYDFVCSFHSSMTGTVFVTG